MSRFRYFVVVMVLLLALAPLAALAQEDQVYEEFVSENGLLTMLIPEGWFTVEDQESPFPSVVVINSEEGQDRIMANEDPISGDQAVLVFVLPSDFFAFMGVMVSEEATAIETVDAVSALFFEPEVDEEGNVVNTEDLTFGEAEEVELAEELLAGSIDIADPTSEGKFVTFFPGNGLLVIVFSVAFPGEFTPEQAAMGLEMAASLSFDGTGDSLMAAMMGGAAEAPSESSAGDYFGATLIEERCSVCHTTDRIYDADKDEVGWTATIDRMIGYGAELDEAEREAVLQYLVENQ